MIAPFGSLVGRKIVQASYDGHPGAIHNLVITLSGDKRVVVRGEIQIEEVAIQGEVAT